MRILHKCIQSNLFNLRKAENLFPITQNFKTCYDSHNKW